MGLPLMKGNSCCTVALRDNIFNRFWPCSGVPQPIQLDEEEEEEEGGNNQRCNLTPLQWARTKGPGGPRDGFSRSETAWPTEQTGLLILAETALDWPALVRFTPVIRTQRLPIYKAIISLKKTYIRKLHQKSGPGPGFYEVAQSTQRVRIKVHSGAGSIIVT